MAYYGGLNRALAYNDAEERRIRLENESSRRYQDTQQRQAVEDQRYNQELERRRQMDESTDQYRKAGIAIRAADIANDTMRRVFDLQRERNKFQEQMNSLRAKASNIPSSILKIAGKDERNDAIHEYKLDIYNAANAARRQAVAIEEEIKRMYPNFPIQSRPQQPPVQQPQQQQRQAVAPMQQQANQPSKDMVYQDERTGKKYLVRNGKIIKEL